jgi:hypothetical protein
VVVPHATVSSVPYIRACALNLDHVQSVLKRGPASDRADKKERVALKLVLKLYSAFSNFQIFSIPFSSRNYHDASKLLCQQFSGYRTWGPHVLCFQ